MRPKWIILLIKYQYNHAKKVYNNGHIIIYLRISFTYFFRIFVFQRRDQFCHLYWYLGTINTCLRNLFKTSKQRKMTEIIPYFAGLITLLFGIGFLLALREMNKEKF